MKALTTSSKDEMYSYADGLFLTDPIDVDVTNFSLNFTPPADVEYKLMLNREVSLADVKKQTLNLMPGFEFSWFYTGMKAQPKPIYQNDGITKKFVRDK